MNISKKMKFNEYRLIYYTLIVLFGLSIFYDATWQGLRSLVVHSDILVADYFAIGGIGSTYLNLALMLLMMLFLMIMEDVKLDSNLIASIYLILGFSYYGKNVMNTLPLVLGSYIYYKINRGDISDEITNIFGTMGIAPFITELLFHLPIHSGTRLVLGVLVGMIIGALLQPINTITKKWHQGFSLYSMGLSIGILSFFFVGLYKVLGYPLKGNVFVDVPVKSPLLFMIFAFALFSYSLVKEKGSLKNYLEFIKNPNDQWWETHPYAVLMNVSVNIILSLVFIDLVKIPYSGPVIGGVLAVVGYSFNYVGTTSYFLLLLGMGVYNHFTMTWDVNQPLFSFLCFYGTCLTPIFYRANPLLMPIFVIMNGHLVRYTAMIHNGTVLYNTGFAAGILGTLLVTLNNITGGKIYPMSQNEEKNCEFVSIDVQSD